MEGNVAKKAKWIDQGIVDAIKKGGTVRIPREEVLKSKEL